MIKTHKSTPGVSSRRLVRVTLKEYPIKLAGPLERSPGVGALSSSFTRKWYTRETHEFIVRRLICAVPLTRMFLLPHKSSTRSRNTKTYFRFPAASKKQIPFARKSRVTICPPSLVFHPASFTRLPSSPFGQQQCPTIEDQCKWISV